MWRLFGKRGIVNFVHKPGEKGWGFRFLGVTVISTWVDPIQISRGVRIGGRCVSVRLKHAPSRSLDIDLSGVRLRGVDGGVKRSYTSFPFH